MSAQSICITRDIEVGDTVRLDLGSTPLRVRVDHIEPDGEWVVVSCAVEVSSLIPLR